MKIKQNFHNHSQHSCDSACASILTIMAEMKALGIEEYGLTDHLHTRYNFPDIISSRRDFLASKPPKNFHFGVEASVVDQREVDRISRGDYTPWGDEPVYGFRDMTDYSGVMAIDLTPEQLREQGIEYVVGGVHWPLTASEDRATVIRNYFDIQMFIINHPLVNILAHPWDSLEHAAGGWFIHRDAQHIDRTACYSIPREYNDELARALISTGKAAEINIEVLCTPHEKVREYYLDLFSSWKSQGVKFTIGYDIHSAHFDAEKFNRLESWLTERGFTDSDFILPF